jgi:hypothetical protein
LLGGGAPLLTALDDTIQSIGDPVARDDACGFARVRGDVAEGAVSEGTLFPPMLAQLIAWVNAGQLRVFLAKRPTSSRRTERATQRLATWLNRRS